jgi:hypothetical protein
MRALIVVLLVGCASGKDMQPAGSAESPKPDQVAMGGAPEKPAARAAGDPCEGGQVAPAATATAAPLADKPAVVATAGGPGEGGGDMGAPGGVIGGRGGGPAQGAPAGHADDLGLGGGAGSLRGPRVAPQARIALGTVKVEGALAQEIVLRIVRQHIAQLRACYEGQLKRNPKLSGLEVVHFTIDAEGSVPNAQVTKGLDGDLDACMIARVKALAFPKPEKGTVNVELPLNLSQPY